MPDSLLDLTVAEYLDGLASDAPTPGGGAVAALTGAQAAGLGRMACSFTVGKPRFADVEARVAPLAERLARADELLRRLADEDAAAYEALSAAFKLPKSDPLRSESIAAAAETAATVPLETLALARDVRRTLAELAPLCNPNLRSDVEVGLHLAEAAMRSAAINIRVNLPFLTTADADRINTQMQPLVAD